MRFKNHPVTPELRLERGDGVLGEGRRIYPTADCEQILPGVQLGTAGEAGLRAQNIMGTTRSRLCQHIFEADIASQVVLVGASFAHIRRDSADPGIGEMTCHPTKRIGEVDNVCVHDQQRLHPVVLEHDSYAVIERVCLAFAALIPAQMKHGSRVLLRFRRHHTRCIVCARVVDDIDTKTIEGVIESHETVDGCRDHRALVPGGNHDRHPGKIGRRPRIMIADGVQGDQEKRISTDHHGNHPRRHEGEKHDLQYPSAEEKPIHDMAPSTVATRSYRPMSLAIWLSVEATMVAPA